MVVTRRYRLNNRATTIVTIEIEHRHTALALTLFRKVGLQSSCPRGRSHAATLRGANLVSLTYLSTTSTDMSV